ncbi:hypothetical protein M422DRAFT_23528 [Sphaerobolus stellatus SS14]|nr:hypothetical protein M422DRAFT_23528 [Sphaerobolus stellatus SS14]
MDLEQQILSGVFFSTSPSNSPVRTPDHSRSPSPDPLFPSNEDQGSDFEDNDDPSTSIPNIPPEDNPNQRYVRGGRTGVKGVIQDAKEVERLDREKRAEDIKELNRRMENAALTARTYAEEEEERLREKALEEGLTEMEFERNRASGRSGWFGHLREVGADTFPEAVDGESSDIWVVVHIYDPNLTRSHAVDVVLARLARQYPQTKFLRARAGALGFASATMPRSGSSSRYNPNSITVSEKGGSFADDEEDPYAYDDDDEDFDGDGDVVTDTDMLPTMLVYRGGRLVHNWIRVDWEADAMVKRKEGSASGSPIEALLRGHNILRVESNGNCGFSDDDEDLDLKIVPGDKIDDEDSDEIFDL